MSKGNKPRAQHYIPRVYLKQFQIDGETNKSFVYCLDTANPYSKQVRRLGLNDRVFKFRDYYNDHRLENPFMIEMVLANDVEPTYETIMQEIKKEEHLTLATRENLIAWLFYTQHRAPYLRDNIKRVTQSIIELTNAYKKRVPNQEEQNAINQYIAKTAREVQLDTFSSPEQSKTLLEGFINTLNAKHWKILKSLPDFPFWTNDNPGFSPNQHPKFAAFRPFHPLIELNAGSIVYFVFSPEYCLEIRPFFEGTPLDICALNMDIPYEQAPLEYIKYINEGVFYTRYKLLISNRKEGLKNQIKFSESVS